MSPSEKYGKRRQVTFRIGPLCQEKLEQVAALFNMKPTEYIKAILYRDLQIFDESLDMRRRSHKQRRKRELMKEDDKLFAEDLQLKEEEE